MALTLDISNDMETLLRLQAAKGGQDVTGYLLRLVESDLQINLAEYAGLEDFASSVAGIQAGIEDMEAGRTLSFEETFTQLEAEKVKWRQEQAAKREHSSEAVVAA